MNIKCWEHSTERLIRKCHIAIYLMTLPVAHTISRRKVGRLVNNQLKEVTVKLKVLFEYLPGQNENYKKNTARIVGVSAEIRTWDLPPNTSQKHYRLNQSALCWRGRIYARNVRNNDSELKGSNHCPLWSAFNFLPNSDDVNDSSNNTHKILIITKTNWAEQGLYAALRFQKWWAHFVATRVCRRKIQTTFLERCHPQHYHETLHRMHSSSAFLCVWGFVSLHNKEFKRGISWTKWACL
jgi:hypothetical protein